MFYHFVDINYSKLFTFGRHFDKNKCRKYACLAIHEINVLSKKTFPTEYNLNTYRLSITLLQLDNSIYHSTSNHLNGVIDNIEDRIEETPKDVSFTTPNILDQYINTER